jgi:hypothetical protein
MIFGNIHLTPPAVKDYLQLISLQPILFVPVPVLISLTSHSMLHLTSGISRGQLPIAIWITSGAAINISIYNVLGEMFYPAVDRRLSTVDFFLPACTSLN